MNLLNNITNNFYALQNDFIGFSISFPGIFEYFLRFIIALCIVLIYKLLGQKIRKQIFHHNSNYNFFIDILLGYGLVGSVIAILGIFSLLRTDILLLTISILASIGLYPYNFLHPKKDYYKVIFKKAKKILQINFLTVGIFLFCFISIVRLATPEIAEDAYHTDFPIFYIATQTTMHESKDPFHIITFPQLAEMNYIIPIVLGHKEASRFLHTIFYLLIVLLLFKFSQKTNASFSKYSPLLFVTAPVVIRYAPTQYIDFFMVFAFLLSVLLIISSKTKKDIFLSGIILGVALATKLWILIYIPVFIISIYLTFRKKGVLNNLKRIIIFLFGAFIFPSIWYVRTFIITGNPIYPILAKIESLESNEAVQAPLSNYLGFNWNMFSPDNMIVLSPIFFLSIIMILVYRKPIFLQLKKSTIFVFIFIFMIEQLLIKVDLGRYLLAWYTIVIIVASAGITYSLKNRIFRITFFGLYLILFIYYAITTIIQLPYGFGWADKNSYLTRVLGKDNASYYDFDHLFDKHINAKDLVATYGIFGYYYADFNYLDVNYVFSKRNRSAQNLKDRNMTKLLIKGGDFAWFCKHLKLSDCDKISVDLLVSYQAQSNKYMLYKIRE